MVIFQRRIIQPARAALGGLPAQLRNHVWWYLAVAVVLTILGLIVLHLHFNTHLFVDELFADPVELATLPLHVGIYTYISATALVVAGSLLLFAGFSAVSIAESMKTFLILLGAFILWLGLDDVFMIHEYVGLRLAWFIGSEDVPRDRQWLESFVFAAYAMIWVSMVVVFAKRILRTAWILLALTFLGFGISVVLDLWGFIDSLPNPSTPRQVLFISIAEDMAKLAGGLFVLAYAVHVARGAVRGVYALESDSD